MESETDVLRSKARRAVQLERQVGQIVGNILLIFLLAAGVYGAWAAVMSQMARAEVTVSVTDLDGNPIPEDDLSGILQITFGTPPIDPPIDPPFDPCDETPEAAGCPCPDGVGMYPYCPDPPIDPPIDPPVELAWNWTEVPNSAMDMVKIDSIDESPLYTEVGAWRSWLMIQEAESGAACANGELFVTGGGHADGAHNGVLALDVEYMQWRRAMEPSPLLMDSDSNIVGYHNGDRIAGDYTCGDWNCNVGPDGQPTAQHTYDLLTSDGESVYMMGGSVWKKGSRGDSPSAFRFDIASGRWEPITDALPDGTIVTKPNGSAHYIDGVVYLLNGSGWFLYDVQSDSWSRRSRLAGWSNKSTTEYDPDSETFLSIGDGRAVVTTLENFGVSWETIDAPEYLVEGRNFGMLAHEGKILVWDTGRDIGVFDPVTREWAVVSPGGDYPGEDLVNGSFGRFSNCGGKIVLVNGVSANTFVLSQGEYIPPVIDPPEPPVDPCDEDPTLPECSDPVDPPVIPPSNGDLPDIELVAHPYYDTQQTDIVERVCGPMDEWSVVDIRNDADLAAWDSARRLPGDRYRLNIYWQPTAYEVVKFKTDHPSCYAAIGISGPEGQKPTVKGVNATHKHVDGGLPTQKGVIIENLYVSQFEWLYQNPDGAASGDCVGMPNDGLFFIIRNTDVWGCYHHSLITSRAYALYFETTDSTFARSYSHNLYVDAVAMWYADNIESWNPGWGHAYRCTGAVCIVKNSTFSNVNIDGTKTGVYEKPDGKLLNPIGMAAIEVYGTCGGPNTVENVELFFWRQSDNVVASQAANIRTRDARWGCDLSNNDGHEWNYQEYGSDEWWANDNWQERITTIDNLTINCVSDGSLTHCDGIHPGTTLPIANDPYRDAYQVWARAQTWDEPGYTAMEQMLMALPEADLPYPWEWYEWTASQVLPFRRESFANGQATSKWPVQPHPDVGYREIATTYITNSVIVRDGVRSTDMIRPANDADFFCWSGIQGDDCPDPLMPLSSVYIDGELWQKVGQ